METIPEQSLGRFLSYLGRLTCWYEVDSIALGDHLELQGRETISCVQSAVCGNLVHPPRLQSHSLLPTFLRSTANDPQPCWCKVGPSFPPGVVYPYN